MVGKPTFKARFHVPLLRVVDQRLVLPSREIPPVQLRQADPRAVIHPRAIEHFPQIVHGGIQANQARIVSSGKKICITDRTVRPLPAGGVDLMEKAIDGVGALHRLRIQFSQPHSLRLVPDGNARRPGLAP